MLPYVERRVADPSSDLQNFQHSVVHLRQCISRTTFSWVLAYPITGHSNAGYFDLRGHRYRGYEVSVHRSL